MRFLVAITAAVALVGVGCSDGSDGASDRPATTASSPEATPMGDADLAVLAEVVDDGACDELDAARCLLPFPSDRFTEADGDAATGRRIALPEGQLANASGSPLDVTEWNRNDGFSPGSAALISAPNVDLEASGTAPIGNIARSMEADSPTVLYDLTDGRRIPHWVEVDSHVPADEAILVVRPAVALPEGHRIGVAIGELTGTDGEPLVASLGFRAYRDRLTTDLDPVEDRRDAIEEVVAAAVDEGLDRETLFAAWDFTVASADNLAGRMLTMRDDAFERLGDAAPSFTVTETITDDLPDGIARRVRGTFSVPSYLTGDGEPGARLVGHDRDELPSYSGSDLAAVFTCQIPEAALAAPGSSRAVVYGHGLLGSSGEAENSQVAKIASTNNMTYCATDWIGMSTGDVGNAVSILGDLSLFPSLPDRSQQGILNTLFLARTMTADGGFGSHPAFQTDGGAPVLDTTEAYFDGNSQGGIMGGAATAVSTEWTKAVLGVPGMNYSLLLSRSVDFEKYFTFLRQAYPDPVDQAIVYPLLSMLWDRAESNGYAQHMTDDPYPGTPSHQVVLDVGFGDHQVAQVSAEIMARTIGAAVRGPALADGRHPDERPFYGLDVIEDFPTDRSLLVYWDSGSFPPPPGDVTPVESEEWVARCSSMSEAEIDVDAQCADSHEDPRRAPQSIAQKGNWFRPDAKLEDPCDPGVPCTAAHRKTLDY